MKSNSKFINRQNPCSDWISGGEGTLYRYSKLGQKFCKFFCQLKKNFAFTLAECLITLAIIGVVAAITLPPLVHMHNIHITEIRLKKFYADFNNAIRMAESDYGPHQYWSDYWALTTTGAATPEKIEKVMNKYFAPYIKISKIEIINGQSFFVFPDGSAFAFQKAKHVRDIIFFPKNYKKISLKAKQGVNCFIFEFVDHQTAGVWRYVTDKGLVPYLYAWNGTVWALMHGEYPCTKNGGAYCTELIRHNNWKVPKDYPAKIRY